MENYQRRNRQLGKAIFDHFVNEQILEKNSELISEEGEIDKRFLNELAKKLDCDPLTLDLAINTSSARILNDKPTKKISVKKEDAVILVVIKRKIKGNKDGLINVRRMFGNLATQLNKRQPNLRTNTNELLIFVNPIYHDVVDELLCIT